jgi:hypothetical protein
MKAQLSFEMQLYLALAGIALLFAVSEFVKASPEITGSITGYRIAEFVDLLNENMLAGNSTFLAYLPEGLCNSSAIGSSMDTSVGTYETVTGITVNGSAFCPDNSFARLYLKYSAAGGPVEVSR